MVDITWGFILLILLVGPALLSPASGREFSMANFEAPLGTPDASQEVIERANLLRKEGDYQSAVSLLKSAHDSGVTTRAAGVIADMYLTGEIRSSSVPGADYKSAIEFLEKGAASGDASCHKSLGFLYSTGFGFNGTADMPKSLLHYFMGAQSGECKECSMTIGYRYLNGYGVPKNCDGAVKYYMPVSEAVVDSMDTTPSFERVKLTDDTARHKPTEESKDVIHYFEHAADGGDVNAQVVLGQLHQRGLRGIPQDHGRAAHYFRRAADQGDANAMAHLGAMHANGQGMEQNNKTALSLFRKSSALGSAAGYTGLAFMYAHGQGVPQNMQLAVKYYKEAADLGSADAQYALGMLYYTGAHVDKSYVTALHYFTMAGHQGHTPSLYNLAQMQLLGLGTLKSCSLGVRLHKVVAERGAWAAERHTQGHSQFLAGNYEAALWHYGQCAMAGDEICQTNVAWMLGEALGYYGDDHEEMAIKFWRMAADQGSAYAQRILGDMSYYGVVSGGAPEATRRYQQAAEKSDAQALFNLGYMHEWGPDQDLHLAKRSYDSAKQADPSAFVPVQIALLILHIHMWWLGITSTPVASTSQPTRSPFSYVVVENVILCGLCCGLAVVVYIRRDHILRT
uniref:Uncharacterized protein n=1 Tax=Spongospora subterranea TaxID=70186 RepID=A0A0H5R9C3_9EUKA|eukprot:CRZ10725.1 hypothetical protein [Spongospora subterranea]